MSFSRWWGSKWPMADSEWRVRMFADEIHYAEWIGALYPPQGEWSERDYFSLPETMWFIELVDGAVSFNCYHTPRHQIVLGNMMTALHLFLNEHSIGQFIQGPYALRLGKDHIRVADIMFAFNEHKKRITNRYFRGAPDWIIEVIVEETRHTDEVEKVQAYARAGVLEYWTVDLDNQTVRVYSLQASEYELHTTYSAGDIAQARTIPGFTIAIDEVFRQ
jgi:Uma2 family endonuclease